MHATALASNQARGATLGGEQRQITAVESLQQQLNEIVEDFFHIDQRQQQFLIRMRGPVLQDAGSPDKQPESTCSVSKMNETIRLLRRAVDSYRFNTNELEKLG